MNSTETLPSQGFYRPLAPPRVRVFELQPGECADPIVGRLVHQAIDGEPYEAVSYVWGDRTKRRDITVDGKTLSVTASLHGALTAFRHRPVSSCAGPGPTPPPASRVRRLWADAICINQGDLQERTSQVELMADIFAGAQRVLAWLGWEESAEDRRRTRLAMDLIRSFVRDPEAALRAARVLLLDDGANPGRRRSLLSEDDQRQFDEQAHRWAAIKAFFATEYLHRTWIVQELGLAREAKLYTALKPGVDEAAAATDSKMMAKEVSVDMDSIDWKLVGSFVEYLDFHGASVVTHLGLLLWVTHHILMIWEKNDDGTPACDFLTAMHWARILGVTDARDRVYSLLGHPLAVLDDGELVIRPDYTVTRGVAYTRLAARFIRKTRNLYVVSLVDHENDPRCSAGAGGRNWDSQDDGRMPSWVPDWHSINRTTPMPYPFAAAETEDPDIQIIGAVDGGDDSPMPRLLVRGWIVDEVAAVSRRMETTDFPLTSAARERGKTTPFWLDRVWEVVAPTDRDSDEDALAVLEALSLALALGTRQEGQPLARVGGHQTLEEHQRSFAAYVLEYHALTLSSSCSPSLNSDDDDVHRPARSLYDSLPAGAQAELRRQAEGTTGARFIECMTWPAMCRLVYRTRSGLVGMGSRVTRPGDLVCRVRGSGVLMTLRGIESDDYDAGLQASTVGEIAGKSPAAVAATPLSCAYIGPTVVPERMKKGCIDGGDFGERATDFCIV